MDSVPDRTPTPGALVKTEYDGTTRLVDTCSGQVKGGKDNQYSLSDTPGSKPDCLDTTTGPLTIHPDPVHETCWTGKGRPTFEDRVPPNDDPHGVRSQSRYEDYLSRSQISDPQGSPTR